MPIKNYEQTIYRKWPVFNDTDIQKICKVSCNQIIKKIWLDIYSDIEPYLYQVLVSRTQEKIFG